MKSPGFELRPTEDHDMMVRLAKGAGLEIDRLDRVLSAYGAFDSEEMIGCACLKKHEETYLLECLAVEDKSRRKGVGTRLVKAIEAEAKSRGGNRIVALARSPGFFLKIGYREAKPGEVTYPTLSSCEACPQFRNPCSPAVVLKVL